MTISAHRLGAAARDTAAPDVVYALLLYAILLVLPFYRLLDLNVGVAAISVVDALIIVGGVYLVAQFLLARGIVLLDSRTALIGVGIFFVAILLSMVAAKQRGVSTVFLLSMVLKVILFYIAFHVTARNQDPTKVIKCYLVGASLMALIAIFQQLRNWQTTDAAVSAAGAFDARNELTFYLAPAAVLALVLAGRSKGRVLYGTVFGLVIAALVLSRGRAGTLLAIAGACIYLFFLFSQPGKRWTGLALCIALVGTVLALWWATGSEGSTLRNRYSASFQSEIEDERGSTYIRLVILEGVWRAWLDHPWFGIGAGNFKGRSSEFVQLPFIDEIQPHNTYLGILAELGIVGLLGLFLILLPAIWRLLISKSETHPRDVRFGIALAYGIALAHLLTFDGATRYSLWVLVGICYGLIYRGPLRRLSLH